MAKEEITLKPFNYNGLIELYMETVDEDNDSFSLGYVLYESNDYILFLSINENSMVESVQLRIKKYVSDIQSNTDYLKMFLQYISYVKKKGIFDPFRLINEYEQLPNKSLEGVLDYFLEKERIISVVTAGNEEIITGKIILLEDHSIVLTKFDFNSTSYNEKVVILKSEIICVDLFSSENLLLQQYLLNNVD